RVHEVYGCPVVEHPGLIVDQQILYTRICDWGGREPDSWRFRGRPVCAVEPWRDGERERACAGAFRCATRNDFYDLQLTVINPIDGASRRPTFNRAGRGGEIAVE